MPLIPDTYAELSSKFSTSNTTYTKALETAALPSGGKYLVIVNANAGNTGLNKSTDIKVTYNSSELSGSQSSKVPISISHEERYSYFSFFDTTVSTGTVALEVMTASGGEAVVKSATIACLDLQNLVAGSDYIFEENSFGSFNTTSFSTKESISIPATIKTTGQWLVLAQVSSNYAANGIDHHVRINYLNSDLTHERIERIDPGYLKDVNYIQKIVGVPYLGFPPHLGGTEEDGSSKRVGIQTKDSEDRVTNTLTTGAKIFALRLSSVQYYKQVNSPLKNLESDGSFDEIIKISDYNPIEDAELTTAAGSYRSGKTLGLVYAHFNPNTADNVGQRVWMNVTYDGADAIDSLKDDTIQTTSHSHEMSNMGFAFLEDSETSISVKECIMSAKTYHASSRVHDISMCLISLGSPVPDPGVGGRAVLELNRVIRIR